MTRWLIGMAAVAVGGGVANAQAFGAPGAGGFGAGTGTGVPTMGNLNGAFAPNFYNRTQQPLSPYLNLLNGGNPAVGYFYGTRPGLNPAVSGIGGGTFGYQGPALGPPGTGNRFYLQPPAVEGEPPYQPFDAARRLDVIPTAAHPVTFNARPALAGFRSAAGNRTGFSAQQPAAPRPAPTPRR